MADVGGDSSGRSQDRYIPSYDAPTAPIPAIRAEDGTLINPRVPRRFPIGDGEETVLVPRPVPATADPVDPNPVQPEPAGSKSTEPKSTEPKSAGPEPASSEPVGGKPARRRSGEGESGEGELESAWFFPALGFPERVSVEPASVVTEPAEQEAADPEPAGPDPIRSFFPPRTSGPESAVPYAPPRPPGPGPVRTPPGAGSAGPFPLSRPATSSLTPGSPPPPFASRATPRAVRVSAPRKDNLLMRIGDIPIRVVYSFGAALVTALAVFLIFVLFSGDQPAAPARTDQAGAGATAQPSPSASPITLPSLPAPTALRVLPGARSPVLGAMTDSRAAITYAKLGRPWAVSEIPSFSVGQRVGTERLPSTMIVSGLLPGDTPRADLKTDAQFRTAATGAVKWAIRNHYPAGGKVVWTASQKPVIGKGWTLGYRVTYVLKGRKRTSQAALTLLDIGRRRPAMLLVTVPDTRKQLWADIAPLVASARPL